MKQRNALIVGAVVILGTFGWLLFGGLNGNVVYFLTPQELLAKGTEAQDVPVRLGGQVKPGSVVWNAETLDLRFTVVEGVSEVAVKSRGAPPQMFRGGIGVVVEGRMGGDGTFQSSNLMVKHSNEYHPPDSAHAPKEMYKTLLQGSGE